MKGSVTIDSFKPFVGRAARLAGAAASLVLDRVEAGPTGPPEFRQPFTLVFRAARTDPTAQEGLYLCEIEDAARFELYIVPIHTPEPDYQDYQAVFN